MQEKEALMHCNPTRRTFLKGTAATAALAAVGTCSVAAWRAEQAEAAATGAVKIQGASLCNGCSSKCGLIATALDGRLWTVEGMKEHPYSKGTLCGRGHGAAQWAYSDGRLTQPMKRAADGSFAPISWDDALSEIGAKVQEIIAEAGPEALAIIQDPRPSGKYYSKRFMNALGSPNVYTHAAACNLSKESGIQEATGAQNFSVDFPNTKMVVFIGRSYGDGIRPSSVKSLAGAAEGGARVVIVDPRLNNTGVFATDWVPIRPGADIAFLLGIANVLVTRDLYDHAFVEQSAVGFPEFAAQVTEYTPEWAEGICDVPADTIVEIAESLAAAAPGCAIEPSWRAAFGCAYQNSFETARAVCAVNALLGCWGQKGGALITSSPKVGDVDPVKFPEVPKPAAKRLGDAEYPLALSGTGTNLAVLNGCADGVIQGVFFYNSNAVQGYAQPAKWREALSQAKLVVTIDVQMSETALASDYVLPECTVLERLELPEFIGGKKHYVALRTPIIERIHPETRPCDEIFAGLAEACGVGQYFPFTVDELADAQLRSVGTSLDELRQVGTISFPEKAYAYGKVPEWKTPTGKIQFTSEACEAAGLSACPVWVEPQVMPNETVGEFRLIGGKQAIHTHTQTANCEPLMDITKSYGLDRIWINAEVAERLGIADGDEVILSNTMAEGPIKVKVTERINPTAIYMPSHYGCKSPDQRTAYGVGLNFMDFVPFHMEPAYGSAMTQETLVSVQKVGE